MSRRTWEKVRKAGRAVRNAVPILILRQLDRAPILIGGCARSGTTLLQSILSAHPHIFAFPRETGLFCPGRHPHGAWRFSDAPLPVLRFYRSLLIQNIPREARRWCEKTPRNVHYFGRILDHFRGRVRLIHVVRDGRDVVTSRHPRRPAEYWVSPRRWVQDVSAGLAFEGHEAVLTIRYEDLVTEKGTQLAKLGAFLDEDFSGVAGSWEAQATLRQSSAWFHEVADVHTRSIGRWRAPDHREVVEEMMAMPESVDLLERLGYLTREDDIRGQA